MSTSQRRIGPFNLGHYGLLSSIVNGFNLILQQYYVPKVHFYFGFQLIPLLFFLITLFIYDFIFPFFVVDLFMTIIILNLLFSLSILFIVISSFTQLSKYSMLGCIRLISQLISFELISSSLIILFMISFNSISVCDWFLIGFDISSFHLITFNYLLLSFMLITILAESNRVPFDLAEAESELVAGFITEYGSLHFSLILLTEYATIIVFVMILIILFHLPFFYSLLLLCLIGLVRCTLVRLKYDELMINA